MSRAARETQAQDTASALQHGTAPPKFERAPALATPFSPGAAPLPAPLRGDMEARFGQDFSTVRVAADRNAERAARGFGARAFAQGEQISLADGVLEPGLVAHELTHVLQQRQARRIEIACDGPGLDQTVAQLRVEIDTAADAKARKPLVARALALGDQIAAALAAATKAGDDTKAQEARALMLMLSSALAMKDEQAAAVALAGKTPDVEVQSAIVGGMDVPESMAGQQAVMGQLGSLTGQKVAAPGKPEQGRQWLATNSPAIGKTLATLDQRGLKRSSGRSLALDKTQDLMGAFMTGSDQDEKPDATGNVSKLGTDDTTHQIKADCDVYATVAARLLRDQGWETVGYMVVVPDEKDPKHPELDRAAHAVSLARKPVDAADPAKGYRYVGSSNATLDELGGPGTVMANNDAALGLLSDLMFGVYEPKPRNYAIYFQPALKGGAYDMRLLDPANAGLKPWKTARGGVVDDPAEDAEP